MKQRCNQWVYLIILFLVLLSAGTTSDAGSHKVKFKDGHAAFTTDQMVVEVNNGIITKLYNRLTGTEYFLSSNTQTALEYETALVYYQSAKNDRGEDTLVPAPLQLSKLPEISSAQNGNNVVYTYYMPDENAKISLSYSLDSKTGDLLISQKASGQKKALGALRFALGPVTCRGNLLLPSYHGMKANMTDNFLHWEGQHWIWPWTWPLQLVIFDDTLGGFWIYSRDKKGRYKDFRYQYNGSASWHVAFDTLNNAPLASHTSSESVTWRINTYEGDWTVPVDIYKDWAYKAYELKEKAFARPQWIHDIRIQIKHADFIAEDRIEEYLDLLEQHVQPDKTLLYMTDWREPLPYLLPNCNISKKGKRFNEEARKRGFRTMYFSNYWAISPNHPRFEEFRPYLVRNLYTGKYEGWNLRPDDWSRAAGETYQLYYVNPACKQWRQFQVAEYKALFETSPSDGLFLDQTYNIFNDKLIDGMTMIEGNIAYHRQLAEALPGVAFGGENISEITFPYESFFEMHPLGFEYMEDYDGQYRWKIAPEGFDRMVPIMPRFLHPYTRPFGYLGFPETHSKFYPAWRDAVAKYGGIPTITKPTFDELNNPDSEVRRVMRKSMEQPDR
jgi:hypothetical protein